MTGDSAEPFELVAQSAAELAEQLAADRLDGFEWPRTLADLMDVMVATLRQLGVDDDGAERIARALAIAQAKYIGGVPMYLPSGSTLETALLHDAIYRAHRRGNTVELARRHDLTTRSIQMIVRKQMLLRRRRSQRELFPQ